MYLTVEVLVVN